MSSPRRKAPRDSACFGLIWEFPQLRGTFKGSFTGIYKGSTKGLRFGVEGLEFPKNSGTLFWGPCNKDPTI